MRYGHIAAIAALAVGTAGLPQGAFAQTTPDTKTGADAEKQTVALDLEDTDLYAAFKMLFQQAKVNYTLDNTLKGTKVTVHIKQPFRRAIDTLIRASGLPITLAIENGVYSIIPQKAEETASAPVPDGTVDIAVDVPDKPRVGKVAIHNLNSIDIAAMLGGKFVPFTASLAWHGENPYAGNGGFGGNGGGPAAPNGGGNGGNGNGTTPGGAKSGGASAFLPNDILAENIFAFDNVPFDLIILILGR